MYTVSIIEVSKKCPVCGKVETHDVKKEAYDKFQSGMKVQDALEGEHKMLREFLVTGYCFDCQSKLFNSPKPDEDWGEPLGECAVCGCPVYAKDYGTCPQCGGDLDAEE